jgi:hypothetical protein
MCWSFATRARRPTNRHERSGAHLGCRTAGGGGWRGVPQVHPRCTPFISAYRRSWWPRHWRPSPPPAPELTVSTVAALAGQPEIGLGDALGSNVVNIALIFGLALLYRSVQTSRQDFSRDFYLALAVPVLTFFLIARRHGSSVPEALLLLVGIPRLAGLDRTRSALRQRAVAVDVEASELSAGKSLLLGVLGLGALVAAGRCIRQWGDRHRRGPSTSTPT